MLTFTRRADQTAASPARGRRTGAAPRTILATALLAGALLAGGGTRVAEANHDSGTYQCNPNTVAARPITCYYAKVHGYESINAYIVYSYRLNRWFWVDNGYYGCWIADATGQSWESACAAAGLYPGS